MTQTVICSDCGGDAFMIDWNKGDDHSCQKCGCPLYPVVPCLYCGTPTISVSLVDGACPDCFMHLQNGDWLLDKKEDCKYPCDTTGECPYDANSSGLECRNHCGLGVDEDTVDEEQ